MIALPAQLARLDLPASSRRSAAEYYAPLLDSENDVLRVGAWCALLDRDAVRLDQYEQVVELARYGAIKVRAYRFFRSNWEHDYAAAVAAVPSTSELDANQLAMRADLANDKAALAVAHRQRFLATGRLDALMLSVARAEQAGGWQSALPFALDAMVLFPHDGTVANMVLQLLYDARQGELIAAVLKHLSEDDRHPYLSALYNAALRMLDGNPTACLAGLDRLAAAVRPRPEVLARTGWLRAQLAAQAHEQAGNYPRAYDSYVALNGIDNGQPISLVDFGKVILASASLEVPRLPDDPRRSAVVMTGFPRSGTTLLENALAMHPDIETFEEVPSRSSMQFYLDQMLPHATSEADRVQVFMKARDRYYDEMDRRRCKPAATVLIDKMPLRSAEAAFLIKVFPEKRYVFSIRHPFDVVLSCFKQYFGRNIAMEHFRRFDTAAKLYDFTMEQWFSVFGLNDMRVHYVRYDDLVARFDPSVRATLDFLGLPWDDRVGDFAHGADARSSQTPSYGKVRQGLTIGVQSSWRNYRFLFESEAARPLYKWAEFFGYPTG